MRSNLVNRLSYNTQTETATPTPAPTRSSYKHGMFFRGGFQKSAGETHGDTELWILE